MLYEVITMVVNGNLVSGTSGAAGEVGHIKLIKNGKLCGCGQKGCWEAYASATRITSYNVCYTKLLRGKFDMIFQFEHSALWNAEVSKTPNLKRIKEALSKWQNGLEKKGWNALFIENHDLPRVV